MKLVYALYTSCIGDKCMVSFWIINHDSAHRWSAASHHYNKQCGSLGRGTIQDVSELAADPGREGVRSDDPQMQNIHIFRSTLGVGKLLGWGLS